GPAEALQVVPTGGATELERLYSLSGGNPFYLLQLARTPADHRGSVFPSADAGRDDDGAGGTAPPAVAAAIAQELAALSGAARRFAEVASVVGDPFDLDITAAAAGADDSAALSALDELTVGDLVRPSPVPRRFHFRHPLVRHAVYQGASVSTRLAAHSRCAAALADRGAAAATRAHHVEQSAAHGDRAAVMVLVEAAEATASRLPSSAARWLEAALRLLPANAPVDERVRLLLAAATALG